MQWAVKRRKTVIAAAVVIIASSLYAGFAVSSRGFPAATVQLTDGSVWITQLQSGQIGRLNRGIDQLDANVPVPGSFDVLQSGYTVLSYTQQTGVLRSINPATLSLGKPVTLPLESKVSLGDSTIAAASGGDAWVLNADELQEFNAKTPTLTDLGDSPDRYSVIVGTDGVAHAYSSATQTLTNVSIDGSGQLSSSTEKLSVGSPSDEVTVSSVGSVPVVLDRSNDTVLIPGHGSVHVDASHVGVLAIQQPGPANSVVYVASDKGLFAVPLSGGSAQLVPKTQSRAGTPIPPAYVNGCVNAAWKTSSASASYAYQCDAGAVNVDPINDLVSQAQLEFRVNRNIVVLNDAYGGQAWSWQHGLKESANWAYFLKTVQHTKENSPKNTPNFENTVGPYAQPVALPVQLGARPGQTTLLPVLDFDSDPNGGVLSLVGTPTIPASEGQLQLVANATEYQFTPAGSETSGAVTFPYTITDGLAPETPSSTVTVSIEQPDNVSAPQSASAKPLTRDVTEGKTVQFNVLGDWYDLDGDAFTLTSASVPNSGDAITFTPGGSITLSATGAAGQQTLDYTVTSTRGAATSGVVDVDVAAAGGQPQPPQTSPLFAQAVANQSTTLNPLSVDSDPNDVPLRLDSIETVQPAGGAGVQLVPNDETGAVQFLAESPGVYYLQYEASDAQSSGSVQPAPSQATYVRVDVVAPAANTGPVAVQQVAYLQPGGSTVVPVLDNATDPGGSVLVVQSVSGPIGSPVQASVVGNQVVRLSSNGSYGAFTKPVDLLYTISDGKATSIAGIQVIPTTPDISSLPPVAEPTSAIVQEGDVGDIDPLQDDFDPEGGTLTLVPGSVSIDEATSQFPGSSNAGSAFADGDTVRYVAPTVPGQAQITYGVTDGSGQTVDSIISVTVVAPQTDPQPPTPAPLQASVIAGSQVRLTVPLTGVDPQGESVELLGPESGPQLGRVVSVTSDVMVYQAYPGSTGTDEFTYGLRNRSGIVGIGSVRIGIAPPPQIDAPPVANPQSITIKPATSVMDPVLSKDSDPQGYPIEFVPDSKPTGTAGLSATVAGQDLVLKASSVLSNASVSYLVTDGHGLTTRGVVTVLTSATAEQSPQIQDIDVPYLTNPNATRLRVNVLDGAVDPTGTSADLKVVSASAPTGSPTPLISGGDVTIKLTSHPQIVVYTVADTDTGPTEQSSATITVPALDNVQPGLKAARDITTTSNRSTTIPLTNYISDPFSKPLRLSGTPTATNGSVAPDGPAKVTFHPAPDYVGPASVTVSVNEATKGSTDLAAPIVFTLPIAVTGDVPPVFYGSVVNATIGKQSTFDLSKYIVNNGSHGSSVVAVSLPPQSATKALGASVSGHTLTLLPQGAVSSTPVDLTIDLKAPNGLGGSGVIQVDEISGSAGLVAQIPRASTTPQTASVNQGQSISVDVLKEDFNPYPASEQLRVTGATNLTGNNSGTVTTTTSTVIFQASSTFVGVVTILYTVADHSGEAARDVTGTLAVTVTGAPGQPGAPSVGGYGNGTVLLSWSAPTDNGQTIDRYQVSWGPNSQTCTQTTCTITGLQDGTAYEFTVRAHNFDGFGPWSEPSAQVTPDVVPSAPGPPTTSFGNGSITVQWTSVSSPGSAIKCYLLAISPPTVTSPCVTGLSYTWQNLTNGVAYTFTVAAENQSGLLGPPSAPSAPQTPATVPDSPEEPIAGVDPNDPTGDTVDVSWPAVTGSAANGSPVTYYSLNAYQGGSLISSNRVTPTSETAGTINDALLLAASGESYQFAVVAVNKAGQSNPSQKSSPTAVGAPGVVTNVQAKADENASTMLTFEPPATGPAPTSYQYTENGGSPEPLPAGGAITGLTNGDSYTFQVKACATTCGMLSTPSSPITPDVAPNPVTITGSYLAQTDPTTVYTWTAPSTGGCAGLTMSHSTTGMNGPWSTPATAAADQITLNGDAPNLWLKITDSCNMSTVSTAAAATATITITTTYDEGALGGEPLGFDASNFPPNGLFGYQFTDNSTEDGAACGGNLPTDASGDASIDNACGVSFAPGDQAITVVYDGVTETVQTPPAQPPYEG